MMKDKKVLAGGAVLFVALFWFFIKPQFLDAKPVIPPTEGDRRELQAHHRGR